jgi:ferrochelatase
MTMPIDVFMLQLGTPTEPTAKGLRPYLRQFLSDPRVIEAPAILRWILVNLIIVPFRSPKSAEKYRRIWDAQTGSPLLSITKSQRDALAAELGPDYRVSFAMRYGQPSVDHVLRGLIKQKSQRMIVLPMFPQYSATTTASGLDALYQALQKHRVVPALRVIRDYHDDADYLDAITAMITRYRQQAIDEGKEPGMYLISFHGIPIDYIKRGDPYMRQSAVTGKAIAKRMGWKKGDWKLVFQSRLGRQKWLTPYTDVTLKELGREGIKHVLVAQPGFTADCLETIDEIGYEGQEEFEEAGGHELIRVPCANDDPGFIKALANIVRRESFGWK